MGKKAKKKARAPPREKRNITTTRPSKNVSEQSSQSRETAEDTVEAVKERLSCVHFDKGVKLDTLLEKIKSSEQIKCGECEEGVHERGGSKGEGKKGRKGISSSGEKSDKKAIWVCLECGHYACGGFGLPTGAQSDVIRHIRSTHHRIVMQWENPQRRWCFPCQSFLPVEKEENGEKKDVLADVVKLIRDRSSSASVSADNEGSCSGNGSITSEIKSEGAAVSSGVEARSGYVVRGLVNLGNTCFFNSVMQNLLSLDRLREHFLNDNASVGGPLVSSLKKLFAETKPEAGLKSVINPRAFFGSVCSKAPQFRGYQQHDSHELLRCLLDGLSTEESSLRKKLGVADTNGNSSHQTPYIDRIFGGEISSTVSCIECGHSSKVYEPFLDLSLPVPSKRPPPKKHQTVSRGKKAKLPPKRVPKARAKVRKDSEAISTSAASKHIDSNSAGKRLIGAGDSTASSSSSIAPPRSVEDDPISETPQAKTDTVLDNIWLDFLDLETTQDETGLDPQDNDEDSFQTAEANGSVPCPENPKASVSVSDQTSEGGDKSGALRDEDEQATKCNENTFAEGMSAEIDRGSCGGGDPGFAQSSSINPWDEEELPLLVSDSQVLYMPYKEENSCTDIVLAEAEASSSFVSGGGQELNVDFDGFGGLFDEIETNEGSLSKVESSEGGFMAVSSESDPEEIDDSDSPVSIERCLAHFTKPEVLSKDNAWHCENCSRIQKLQRLREKKEIKIGEVNENGKDPSDPTCVNVENGHETGSGAEVSEDGSGCEGNENEEAVDSEKVIVKRDATKRVLINKVPPILTVHLKRFSQDARGRLSKLSGHVAFKELMDLRLYMDSRWKGEEKPRYRLTGVVEHMGTMRGGHYVAYVRGGGEGQKMTDDIDLSVWYYVSDSHVRRVTLQEVLRCEAYILFYERI